MSTCIRVKFGLKQKNKLHPPLRDVWIFAIKCRRQKNIIFCACIIDSTLKRKERGAVALYSCLKSSFSFFFSILQMIANTQSAIDKTNFFEGNLTDETSILYLVLCYKQESIRLKTGE